jgi:kynureninase
MATAPRVELGRKEAVARDARDALRGSRDRFALPTGRDGSPKAYLAGQSLGAQPMAARVAVTRRLDQWAELGVDGWFARGRAWLDVERQLAPATGRLVGADPDEITTANTLSVNLHLLLAALYRPDGERRAILIDAPTFPSDRYVVESHLRFRGLDPEHDLVVVRPRDGEDTIRPDDLDARMHELRGRLALGLLAGVNYATGQALDIRRHTASLHEVGALAIWDLAHAAGNVPLTLHDDEVDAAAWCTYKYLNSGPGALAQLFVHRRLTEDGRLARLAGWWGNDPVTRFEMAETFVPGAGADGLRISTPPLLALAPIAPSLAIFDEVGMAALRVRSIELTGYLETLVDARLPDATILTPRDPAARGAQLSLRLPDARRRLAAIEALDVVADFREPDIIRLAPVPLYNAFEDIWRAVDALARTAG